VPTATEGMQVVDLPISEVYSDDEFNSRGAVMPMDVVDLARNIEKVGLAQPICVQPWTSVPGKKYRIVSGHRRYMAFKVLSRDIIPGIIMPNLSEDDALILNLSENLKRKNLNIMQEANAVNRLIKRGYNEDALIQELGTSRGWLQIRFMALKLPERIQEVAAAGMLSQEQIRAISSMKNIDQQFEAVRQIKEKKEKGEASVPLVRKKNPFQKKIRNRAEIFEIMEHLQDKVGNGLHTQTIAWAAGEISDLELYQNIKTFAEEKGIEYAIPKEALSAL
jgi:ParB family chromosome partitioning protein